MTPPAEKKTPSFRDSEGREWHLRLTKGRARIILDVTAINFGTLTDGRAVVELATNSEKLAQTLWLLCERQAELRGVAPEEFAELLDGETLDGALDALVEAMIFFTRRAIRPAVEKILRKTIEAHAEGMQVMVDWVDRSGDQLLSNVRTAAARAIKDLTPGG